MFKKSRRKIVAAIMSILVLLWAGSLGVIYSSSYLEMQKQNRQMLRLHAQMYTISQEFAPMTPPNKPRPEGNPGLKPGFDPQSPTFRLSTFYTVAISYAGTVLETVNQPPTVYADETLQQLAQQILARGRETGTRDNLMFYVAEKEGYHLVTFMDNTVINAGAMTLFRYTLIFGGVALVLFFFLAVYLAKKIVNPLEESYQRQKQFISDAGHELKTPVSVIGANADLLTREMGENQWLKNIRYENQRMGMLVGQLMALAGTEKAAPKMEVLELSRLVAGEALPFESVAFEKGLTLNCSIAPGITAEGNSTQLKQLVSILLDNAISHSKQSGEVKLTLTAEQGVARLSVVNPGEEIAPEHRKRIFQRFYRVDSARNGADQHYGLGLAIAKAIVSSHKGNIQVLCYDDLVEFRVSLPAVKGKTNQIQ